MAPIHRIFEDQTAPPLRAGSWEGTMNTAELVIPEEEIARRAYEIWQAHGCPPSDGSEDWKTAKAELLDARIGRNGSSQQRLQNWWHRVRQKIVGNE